MSLAPQHDFRMGTAFSPDRTRRLPGSFPWVLLWLALVAIVAGLIASTNIAGGFADGFDGSEDADLGGRADRIARMHDQVVRAESQAALDLFTKGAARAFQPDRVLRGKVDEVDRMNRQPPQARLLSRFTKGAHFIALKLAGHPAARVACEDLKAVTAFRSRRLDRFRQAAGYRSMNADS